MIIIYFLPYFNLITLIGNAYSWVIHEWSVCRFNVNNKRISDIFKDMIFSPSLCERGGGTYLYFEIDEN